MLMSKIRLFCEKSLEEKKLIKIIDDDFHYLSNVMRCDLGSVILLFNEKNGEFQSKVIEKNKKELVLSIVKRTKYEKIISSFDMVFCPPKSNKLDILIQKCTEIGVNNFIPVISDHTENRKLNLMRIKKIIKESVEQSNQTHLPEIFDPISFDTFIEKCKKDNQIFFADIQSNINFEDLKIEKNKSNSIFIGPEGDFSSKELEVLRKSKNFYSFSLGKRILRSETAAISSLVLFNNLAN